MSSKKKHKKKDPQLSPKKLVETRARNLPLYECYVNTGWQEAGMAHVMVLRKHVNQNITAGVFLVDLRCLGVKDTVFFYNKPEEEFRELFFGENEFGLIFEKIDYHLAHNIVYAGHDFAMDFDIKPHEDFATTKFILEEDNDEVPLVEIKLGDEEGRPLLLVSYPGEYSDVLQKLKRNAGEGNYTYTVVSDEGCEYEDGDEDESYEEDDVLSHKLENYEMGEIGPYAASMISSIELLNIEKIGRRAEVDKVSLRIELLMRMFFEEDEAYVYDEGIEFEWIDNMLPFPDHIDEKSIAEFEAQVKVISSLLSTGLEDSSSATAMVRILEEYPGNVLIAVTLKAYENLYANQGLCKSTVTLLESFAPDQPVAILSLALHSLIANQDEFQYSHILPENNIYKLFPSVKAFSGTELILFWLSKIVWCCRENDLAGVLKNYQLLSDVNLVDLAVLRVQKIVVAYLEKKLLEINDEVEMENMN